MSIESIEALRRTLAAAMAGRSHMGTRFASEIEFAEGLAKLHPDKAKRWGKLIADASGIVEKAARAGKLDRLEHAVLEAEAVLSPIGKVAKRYTVYCVGHAHIDMNWMWSWPETVAVTNDTFRTVLALMDEFPDFCFTQSQASVYALIQEHNPALIEGIRRRVAEGRWEVAAAQWVEGDKNIGAGEAIARHLLYTRRLMREMFDLSPEDVPIGWEPDTFGHSHAIPTIMGRGAVSRYYLWRGGHDLKPLVFWWQGPDGSRLLVSRETHNYCHPITPADTKSMLNFCEQTGGHEWMNVYGVGDHGGGPTRRDLIRAHDMDSWPIYPNYRLSTTAPYYEALEAQAEKWPVLDQELNFVSTGCYTSQAAIKHANRYGEAFCLEAETTAALAARAAGRPYPTDALRQAWQDTLFGHFHDILPGSCVRGTRDYQLGLFQKTVATTGIIKTESLRALAAKVNTYITLVSAPPPEVPGRESIALGAGAGRSRVADLAAWWTDSPWSNMTGGVGRIPTADGTSTAAHVTAGPRTFLVFNPTGWRRDEVVNVTLWDVEARDEPAKSFVVRTPDGRTLATQRLAAGDYWGHRFVDVAFPASVGALGYTVYAIEEGTAAPPEGVKCEEEGRWAWGSSKPLIMENEHLAVAFDRTSGGVVRLIDKASGRDLACPDHPAAILEYLVERPHGGTAWVIGDFRSCTSPLELENLAFERQGPYVAALVAKLKINDSRLSVTYTLRSGQRRLDVAVAARWLERGGPEVGVPMLRMQFPLAVEAAQARYEIPFGWIDRKEHQGEEVPALRWADVTGTAVDGGEPAGCALLNDCKHGHSLDGSTLRLTLIRSSYEPDPLPEIGDHVMVMGLVPHGKALPPAELVRLGAGFNHPLLVVATDVHAGALPPQGEAAAVEPEANLVITSIRKAQEDGALVVHLMETAGRKSVARIRLDAAILGRPAEATEVDLLERPVPESTAKLTADGVSVTVPGRGIAAVKVRFER